MLLACLAAVTRQRGHTPAATLGPSAGMALGMFHGLFETHLSTAVTALGVALAKLVWDAAHAALGCSRRLVGLVGHDD